MGKRQMCRYLTRSKALGPRAGFAKELENKTGWRGVPGAFVLKVKRVQGLKFAEERENHSFPLLLYVELFIHVRHL